MKSVPLKGSPPIPWNQPRIEREREREHVIKKETAPREAIGGKQRWKIHTIFQTGWAQIYNRAQTCHDHISAHKHYRLSQEYNIKAIRLLERKEKSIEERGRRYKRGKFYLWQTKWREKENSRRQKRSIYIWVQKHTPTQRDCPSPAVVVWPTASYVKVPERDTMPGDKDWYIVNSWTRTWPSHYGYESINK